MKWFVLMSAYSPENDNALELLLTRRSHPALSLVEPAPDAEQIKTLLTAAARVPDHGKLSPWRFIIYRREACGEIGETLIGLLNDAGEAIDDARRQQELTRFARAPLVIGVVSSTAPHPKIPLWEQELSVGAVCMNMLLAAHAMGFAGQWLSEWMAFDERAARYLGARDGERFAGFIHLGTPSLPPSERPRPDIDELTTEWGKS